MQIVNFFTKKVDIVKKITYNMIVKKLTKYFLARLRFGG